MGNAVLREKCDFGNLFCLLWKEFSKKSGEIIYKLYICNYKKKGLSTFKFNKISVHILTI